MVVNKDECARIDVWLLRKEEKAAARLAAEPDSVFLQDCMRHFRRCADAVRERRIVYVMMEGGVTFHIVPESKETSP